MSNLSYTDIAALKGLGVDTTPQRDSLWDILKSNAVSAYSNLRFGLPAAIEGAGGSLTSADADYYAKWNDYRQQQAQAMAPTGAASISDLMSGKVGLGRGLAENVTAMLPHMVGAVAGGIVGSAVGPEGTAAGAAEGGLGGLLGMTAGGTPQFIGSNAARALQETGGLTQGQAIRSIAAAPVESALDAVGEAFVPGFGKMLSPVADKLEGTLFRGMASKLDSNILGRTIKTAVEGAVTEATTETAQQAAERWAAGDPLTTPDALREYVQAFGTAAFVGGALGGIAGPFRKHVQATPANEVGNDALAGAVDEIVTPKAPDASGAAATPGMPEDVVQQDLPLVPPPSAFPPGHQGDLLAPGTYDDLNTALAAVPTAELEKVTKNKKTPPAVATAATQELEARTAKNSQVATADDQVAPAADGGDAAVASQDLHKLLGRNQDLKKLQGLPVEDVHAGVTKLLESNDSRASTLAAADHLGIDLNAVDTPVKYTDLATKLDEVKAPDEVKAALAVVPKQRGALPEDVKPLLEAKTGAELDAKIVELLGRDPTFQETASEAGLEPGQRSAVQVPSADLEKIAVHRGLLAPASGKDTAVLDFTDKTREMLKAQELTQVPVAQEEALQAAAAANMTGEQATAFAQGAQGEPLTAPKAVSDIADIGQLAPSPEYTAAHAAGQQWAQSKIPIATAAETRDSIANRLPQTAAQTQSSVEVAANPKLEPAQLTQQDLSNQIDALASPRKVTTAHGTIEMSPGIAKDQLDQLHKLNVNGADPTVVHAAIEKASAGETLFQQPAAPNQPTVPKGEVITRGAPRTGRTGAGALDAQRVAAQSRLDQGAIPKADKARLGIQLKRAETRADVNQVNAWLDEYGVPKVEVQAEGGANETLTRASQRAETAQALKVKRVMDEVKASFNSNDIDLKTYLRLKTALEQGDVKKAIAGLPGSDFQTAAHYDQGQTTKAEQNVADAVEMELRLGNATFAQALNYALEKAPTGFERTLVTQLKKAAAALERTGVKFGFQIVHVGDVVPTSLQNAMGITTTHHGTGAVTVYLNGLDTGRAGVDFETLLHELSHAVTMLAMRQGNLTKYQHLPFFKHVQDLISARNAVVSHFNNRVASGTELTAFEQRVLDRHTNALDDSNEMLAWALSNREMQDYLNGIEVTPTQTLWGKLVDAVRTFLGLDAKDNSALAAVLRASEGVLGGVAEVGFVPYDGTPAAAATAAKISAPRTAAETAAVLKDVVPKITEAASRLVNKDTQASLSRWSLGWQTVHHIAQVMGKYMPSLHDYARIDQERHATHEQIAQLVVEHTQAIHKADTATQERVNSLMYMTEHGADPRQKWSQQTWLHDLPNAAEIQKQLARANVEYNELKRTDQAHLYDDAAALNDMQLYATLAVELYNRVSSDEGYRNTVANAQADPVAAFRGDIDARSAPTLARDFWKGQLDQLTKNAQKYVDDTRGVPTSGLTNNELIRQNSHLSPLEAQLRSTGDAVVNMRQSPYFAMLRHGDYFVSFKALGAKGAMSTKVLDAVAQAFGEAKFKDVYISRSAAEPNVYVRFDNIEQQLQAERLVDKLRADGLLDPETRTAAGPRDSSGIAQNRSSRKTWYDDMIAQQRAQMEADADGMSTADKAAMRSNFEAFESQMRQDWLNTISDNSLVKVMVKRAGRSGYSADMIRSFATRGEMTALALANQSAAPQISEAFSKMRGAVNDAHLVDSPNHARVQGMFDTMNELQRRHQERAEIERTVLGDTLRAVANVFYLGMSPAYVLTQFTQLGSMLLPELGKVHGFSKSFSAIARATPKATRLMAAVLAEGKKQGWKHIGDATITPGVIAAAKLTAAETKFITEMVASGGIDIGAAVRALGWISDGKADSTAASSLRLASAFGLYSEITTRTIAAFAAHELHNPASGVDVADYANHVLKEAMFTYASSNTARKLGKKGFAGNMTPIMTQFMQYPAQLMEKLYREFHGAIKGETPESRAMARKFLAGHAVAVTALAGTLGLPMASAAAWAVEKLADLFGDDDEPFDATASWRGFLASMFGKQIGEVLARGAPRALGFDLSTRVGEQDVLPFTDFLNDRRNWKDASQAQSLRAFGAPVGMGVSVMDGVSKIADGDVMAGLVEMAPTAIKNIGKGYQMTKDGYVDAKGNALPITPGAQDILYQLIGLTPENRAEYSERAGDVAQRQTSMSRQAAVLRNGIVDAVVSGDKDALRDLTARAAKFDSGSPTFAVLPGIEGAVSRKLTNMAAAKALGTPLGLRPADLRGQQLVNY